MTAVGKFGLLFCNNPVPCGSPSDAKRIAAALEVAYPRGGSVEFAEVDAAIDATDYVTLRRRPQTSGADHIGRLR